VHHKAHQHAVFSTKTDEYQAIWIDINPYRPYNEESRRSRRNRGGECAPAARPLPWESIMAIFQALFYLIAILLLVAAALPLPTRRTRGVGLALLAAAFALTAFAAPTIDAGF
jgi:hypothetical protein